MLAVENNSTFPIVIILVVFFQIYTAQGVVMPAGGPMYIPAVGGVPLSPIHQQMAAAAAVGMSQMNPAAVGQTLVGTTSQYTCGLKM